LVQLQKSQEEQHKKLDEIISSKKRKRDSEDITEESDLERAFDTAFRLLKKTKTFDSFRSVERIRQLAEKYSDSIQILYGSLSFDTISQQSKPSPSEHFSTQINISPRASKPPAASL